MHAGIKHSLKFILNPFYRSKDVFNIPPRRNFFWKQVKGRFFGSKFNAIISRFLVSCVLLALLADVIANDKPLVVKYNGTVYFPVFKSYAVALGFSNWPKELWQADWKQLKYDWKIFPPIPYSPGSLDFNNSQSVSPFATQRVSSRFHRHWLGTDELGRDVLSGMIHGTRIALSVGIVAMGIASLLGIFWGMLAGYFGDDRLKATRVQIASIILALPLALFYGFILRGYQLTDALSKSVWSFFLHLCVSAVIFCGVIWLAGKLAGLVFKHPVLTKKVNVPVDLLISRFIEVINSIPTLFLILSISAVMTSPSIYMVMVIIGLTSWTGIARFMRAEMLRIRSLEYIEAAQSFGLPEWRIVLRHAMPNALSPVLITIAFGIAGSILVESTLSFLGIGVSIETVTWGSLLAEARQSPSAWWMALFPGTAIFLTVTVFNLIGDALTDAMDPLKGK